MAPIMQAALVSVALPLLRADSHEAHEGDDHGSHAGDWETHTGACRLTAGGDDGVEGTDFHRISSLSGDGAKVVKDAEDCKLDSNMLITCLGAICKSQCASWQTKHGRDCHGYELGMNDNAEFLYCEIWFTMPAMSEKATSGMHKCETFHDGEWTELKNSGEDGACRTAAGEDGEAGSDFVRLDKTVEDVAHSVFDIEDCEHKCANWATLSEDGNACHAIEVHKNGDKLGDFCEIWVSEPKGTADETSFDCMHYNPHVEDVDTKGGATPDSEDASSAPVAAALAGSTALAIMAAIVV